MRCCNKQHRPTPSNVEIRAVIARCIDPPHVCNKNRHMKKTLNIGNAHNLEKFQGFDEDEPLVQSEVTKCVKKLILTIKMKNQGDTNTQPQFIVIDHVYDPLSDMTVRLLNPYVIKIKQEQINQVYPLAFMDYVNSQAREQVYNKHDGNYTGCCTGGKNPTCGMISYHGKDIAYSTGFCCSCDAEKNSARQPQMDPNPVIGYSDPAYLYDSVQCPRTGISASDKAANREKSKPTQSKPRKGKGSRKRNMEDLKVFYVDPRTQYIEQERQSKSYRSAQVSNKNLRDISAASNYKIQSMNDEYEDQLVNRVNYPNVPDDKDKLKSDNVQVDNKEGNGIENGDVKTNMLVENKMKNPIYEKLPTLKSKSRLNIIERSSQKPSMHKLLRVNSLYSTSAMPDMKSYVKRIGEEAIADVLRSYVQPHEVKSNTHSRSTFVKRQVQSSGVQLRGGQNCADRYTPAHVNPETYHESAHCLRFSSVWYGVYRLEKPLVNQETFFEVFEKYETPGGFIGWKDLTKGKKVKLGTFTPSYKDEIPTISMKFSALFNDEDFCLNWNKLRLLIPEGPQLAKLSTFPEARNGPAEYLLVPSEKIMLSGDKCNVAGVGFEAFFKQPNRCSMPRGSCLHHQPYHLWHYDKSLERTGKQGCFFVKFHGKLAKNPIRRNETTGEKYLNLNYFGKYISVVDMEINADFNAVMRQTTSAIITEVYIDSTCHSRTKITVKVSNAGLLSSKFAVRLSDCPLEMQTQLKDLQSELVIIPPQHQHIFVLHFHAAVQVDIFHCSVEALNAKGELVALRRIKIQTSDRCICTWHCLCACIGSSTGLKCIPMTMDHYHAAGFKGGLPVITYMTSNKLTNDMYKLVLFIFLFILFTLLILGLTKSIIGLCCLPIGMWGLNVLLDLPKPMNRYYERSLHGRPVVYDDEGWPIHPDTKQKVKNISTPVIFCTNVVFFFTYPTIVFLLVLKRLCCPFYEYETQTISRQQAKGWWKKQKCKIVDCVHKSGDDRDGPSSFSPAPIDQKNEKKKRRDGDIDKTSAATSMNLLHQVNDNSVKKGKSPKKIGYTPPNKIKSPRIPKSYKKNAPAKANKKPVPLGVETPSESDLFPTFQVEPADTGRGDVKDVNDVNDVKDVKYVTDGRDGKQKPTIKVSIREHDKGESFDSIANRRTSIEISDNPYYYSSSDDIKTLTSTTPYTETSPSNKGISSKTSSA